MPYRNISLHWPWHLSSFMFLFLLLTLEVQNTIYTFITISTTSWRNWNQIWWSELHKIRSFLTKTHLHANHFWHIVGAILEEFSAIRYEKEPKKVPIIWYQTCLDMWNIFDIKLLSFIIEIILWLWRNYVTVVPYHWRRLWSVAILYRPGVGNLRSTSNFYAGARLQRIKK